MNTICAHVKNVHAWTQDEKDDMRRVFAYVLREWPILVAAYHHTQGTLVMRAEERSSYDWQALAAFDLELVRLHREGKDDEAMNRIAEQLKISVDDLFPDCTFPSYLQFIKERTERQKSGMTLEARPVTAP
jgi:hypothetical protein